MAASLTLVRSIGPLSQSFQAIVPLSATGGFKAIRQNSNTTSVTRAKRTCYSRMYPTILVFPDGSTINIRYKEPRGIIRLPLDFSQLSEAEKKKVLLSRKPKQKLEIVEDFDDSFDVSEYRKFFKK